MPNADEPQRTRRRLAGVSGAILGDPGAPHRVDTLAGLANLSPFHFHRLYHAHTGEPLVRTLRRVRLNQAALLLATTSESIGRIASEVGYDSAQAFSRAFKAELHLNPRAYRQQSAGRFPAIAPTRRRFTPTEFLVDIETTTLPAEPVRALHHAGPVETIGATARALQQHLQQAGLGRCTAPRLGISRLDAGDPKGFSFHLGIGASQAGAAADGLLTLEMPGGLYARHRMTGPYGLIHGAMQRLHAAWLPRSGYRHDAARPAIERYLNSPADTSEHELVTELFVPIQPRPAG